MAGGGPRVLRQGTFGFSWSVPNGTGTSQVVTPPEHIRVAWKGTHKLRFDDIMLFVVAKVAPTGAQDTMALVQFNMLSRCYVHIRS